MTFLTHPSTSHLRSYKLWWLENWTWWDCSQFIQWNNINIGSTGRLWWMGWMFERSCHSVHAKTTAFSISHSFAIGRTNKPSTLMGQVQRVGGWRSIKGCSENTEHTREQLLVTVDNEVLLLLEDGLQQWTDLLQILICLNLIEQLEFRSYHEWFRMNCLILICKKK